MIQTHPSAMILDRSLASAGPSRELAQQDAWAVVAGLRSCQGWTVEESVTYDGLVMIVAMHAEADAALILSGTADQLSLAQVSDDTLQELGTFCRVEDAVARLVEVARSTVAEPSDTV